ncbi:hypothetical protein FOL47_004359, partial [Perkinsus chesapeaki]
NWSDGSISAITEKAFGPAMAWWVLIAAFVASGGQYMADIIEASYLMSGMAQHGLIPSWFGRLHSKFKTPWNAIFFQLLIICALVAADFSAILAVNSFVTCLAALLQFVSFLVLRWKHPNLERPFKVPVKPFWLIVIFTLPALVYGSTVAVVTIINGWIAASLNSVILVLGIV